jgi:hypothetical protein
MYVTVTFNDGQLQDIRLNQNLFLSWRHRQEPPLTPLDAVINGNQIVYLYQLRPNVQTNNNLDVDDDGNEYNFSSDNNGPTLEAYYNAHRQVTTFNELALLLIAFHFYIPPQLRAVASQLILRDELHERIGEDLEFLFGPPVMRARLPKTIEDFVRATDLEYVLETDYVEINDALLDRRRLEDSDEDHWGLISAMLMFAIPLHRAHIRFPDNLSPWAARLYREVARNCSW